MVESTHTSTLSLLHLVFLRSLVGVVYALVLLPFYLVCFPFLLTTRHVAAKKAREALATSNKKAGGKGGVKIKG